MGIIKELDRDGYITWLGDADNIDESKLTRMIFNALKYPERLYKQIHKASQLVGSDGADTVAKLLTIGPDKGAFTVRLATMEDIKLYWEWVNDAQVRKNAFNESFVEWSEHQKWFEESLYSARLILLVIERDKIPIGQVRFDKEGEHYKIDYSLAEQFRGKNLAVPLLNSAIKFLKRIHSFVLIAEVKNSNHASLKVFKKMGFLKKRHIKDKNIVSFQLKINC
jgi:RimJ/RimL family protein N-acetyltransferase